MFGPVLLAALTCAVPPEVDASVLRLAPRQPVGLVLNTPSRQKGRLRVSEILDVLAGAFERDTDLSVVAVAAGAATACEGKLACLTAQVPPEAPMMLVVSYVAAPPGRPDRVSALLVDTASARACAQDVFAVDGPEDCVRSRAVRVRAEPRALDDAEAARAALLALVQGDFRGELEATGHWQPYGRLRISGVPRGATLLLDERPIGVGPGGDVRVEGVPPGDHEVAMQRGAQVLDAAAVRVDARAEAEVRLADPDRGGFRAPLLWSGVTVAAIGAGLTVWSLAYAANQDVQLGCGAPPCGRRFYSLSRMAKGKIENLEEVDDGGVLGLPLGYSLLLTGGTWATGAWLSEDEAWPHWILLGVGLVAGAAAYGISAAANGP